MSRRQPSDPHDVRRGERGEAFHLAVSEFLGGAALFAVGVVLLGAAVHVLDRVRPEMLEPLHRALADNAFRTSDATASLLQSISATVITVASITFSLMLVAMQQSASSLTSQVFGQFLRRRANQFYFGFFVGLGVYALLQAATVHAGFNPVYGATLTVLLSVVAVALLLALVYSAVNQMRPAVIVEGIHDHLIEARARQLQKIVARTRREPSLDAPEHDVHSERTGFVLRLGLDTVQRAIDRAPAPCEVVLDVSIGSYVAYGDRVARVRCTDGGVAEAVGRVAEAALGLERQRNIDAIDAAYGVEQLETVGWTSISGAHHNPQAARLVVASLRDVLARLAIEERDHEDHPDTAIVYHDDFPAALMQTLESLAVVTADSQQHQVAADIIRAVESMLERLSPAYQERAMDLLMRTLPALSSHPPTLALEQALRDLRDTLTRMGADDPAQLVDEGLDRLRGRIGTVDTGYTPR